jgi:phosphoglycolate phosphatase-like HAD superfamily hydrolase
MKRLILFDIDGTLVTGGPAKGAFHLALLEVYGEAGPIEEWEFSGKTDPQIARELLRAAGLPDEGSTRDCRRSGIAISRRWRRGWRRNRPGFFPE